LARFRCHSFFTDFLSPKLARVHECDPTLLSYEVKTPDLAHLFEKFLSLGYGESFPFASLKGLDFFRGIGIELENPEFCFLLFEYLNTDLTPETVVDRLRARGVSIIRSRVRLRSLLRTSSRSALWTLRSSPSSSSSGSSRGLI
jgi:hypothetical protein